jgi:hypothetical protein
VAAAAVVLAIGAFALAGLHLGSAPPAPASSSSASSASPSGPLRVSVSDLGPLLPQALSGLSAATSGGQVYLFGGNGPGGFSDTVYDFNPGNDAVSVAGHLPVALHDGGAAAGAGRILFCGGGQSVGERSIYAFDPATGAVSSGGTLPHPLSDAEGATVGGVPYCLGGWTGSLYSDAVYALQPTLSVAARLPHAVRYSAAAALFGGVLVSGGLRSSGSPTADIQWVPLRSGAGAPAVVGTLPQPLAYAMGAPLGADALVAGGCNTSGTPTTGVFTVTTKGTVTPVGTLPEPLCDGAAADVAGTIYIFGGAGTGGAASAHVWKVQPVG